MATASREAPPLGPFGYLCFGIVLGAFAGMLLLYNTDPARIASIVVFTLGSILAQIGIVGLGVTVAMNRRDYLRELASRDHRSKS